MPYAPGRMDDWTPIAGGGATPIWPKKGPAPVTLSGISTPLLQGGVAVRRSRSMGMITVSPGKSAYSFVLPRAPLCLRMAFQPQVAQGSAESTSTLRMSPGCAPATATGPVKTCGPGAPQNCSVLPEPSGAPNRSGPQHS